MICLEEGIQNHLLEIEPKLTAWRRKFHELAEVGWCEYQTTYAIYEELKELSATFYFGDDVTQSEERMGLPPKSIDEHYFNLAANHGVPQEFLEKMKHGHTGLVAVLDTGNPGPKTAVRIDIDALPIIESTEEDHLPSRESFRSRHKGAMHACGHDGHITIGLALSHLIHALKDNLRGTFTFIFQPAEEGSRGAKAVVAKGWLRNVDIFLSGHIGIHDLPVGTIAATTSQILATTKLDCHFLGREAHAGINPHKGRNALLASASAVVQLQSIPPHMKGITRLNVGKMEAGSGRNIIPGTAFFELETRGETNELNEYMVTETKRIVSAAAQMYGVDVNIETVGEGVAPPIDPTWIETVKQACSKSARPFNIIDELPLVGSEDVAYMMEDVHRHHGNATYMIFASPLSSGHHHAKFDFDEEVLSVAVECVIRTIIERNGKGE